MAGWLVQGVRGEGKSLYAVHRIKDYLTKGRMVATNLDIFIDELVDDDNSAIAFRLPDKPRIDHFDMLPDAYDIKHKGDDKNGLIVLDEMALWFNSRTWKDEGRQEIINWLLLSRKRHWDLILLVQDHTMIDKQIKTTLCDYLVQASRTDRQKIPFFSKVLDFFYIDSYMPKIHVYDIYYGFSALDAPVEVVKILGHDVYDGYDTNQIFGDGTELLGTDIIDMRALYTYLPACYLSGRYYISKHEDQIDQIDNILEKKGGDVAKRKSSASDGLVGKLKLVFLVVALVGWVGWQFFKPEVVKDNEVQKNEVVNDEVQEHKVVEDNFFSSVVPALSSENNEKLNEKDIPKRTVNSILGFVEHLFLNYRPRLFGLATSPDSISANIEFWDDDHIVERFSVQELHALGIAVIVKPYGVNLVSHAGVYPVTSWVKPIDNRDFDSKEELEI